jgi:hypothetical protein
MLMDREELRKEMNQLGCVLDDEFAHVLDREMACDTSIKVIG